MWSDDCRSIDASTLLLEDDEDDDAEDDDDDDEDGDFINDVADEASEGETSEESEHAVGSDEPDDAAEESEPEADERVLKRKRQASAKPLGKQQVCGLKTWQTCAWTTMAKSRVSFSSPRPRIETT